MSPALSLSDINLPSTLTLPAVPLTGQTGGKSGKLARGAAFPSQAVLNLRLDTTSGAYGVESISVTNPFGAVTGKDITNLKLRTIIREHSVPLLRNENHRIVEASNRVASFFTGSNGRKTTQKIVNDTNPPSDDILTEVVAVHRLATASNHFTTVAVARCFNIPHYVAARWVKQARQAGLLD